MRLVRHSILFACLLLSSASVIVHPWTPPKWTTPMSYGQAGVPVATVQGCTVWLDSVPAGAEVSWSGDCSRMWLAHGKGRLTVTDGAGRLIESYDGGMFLGEKSGPGRETKDGSIYTGEFDLGFRAGRGEEIIHGTRYLGHFLQGKRFGAGTMVWPNHDIYRGLWRNGLPDGYGEAVIGGELIAGQWRRGCLLSSERLAAAATPLESCRAHVATVTTYTSDETVGDDPEARAWNGKGCRPMDWGIFGFGMLLCGSLVER